MVGKYNHRSIVYYVQYISRISGFILRERALLLSLALAYVRSIYRVQSPCIVLVLYIRNYIHMKWPHYLVTFFPSSSVTVFEPVTFKTVLSLSLFLPADKTFIPAVITPARFRLLCFAISPSLFLIQQVGTLHTHTESDT